MNFLNPTADIVFKKVFGTNENKTIVLGFLNSILERTGEREIIDVEINDTSKHPTNTSIVDMCCTDRGGNRYLVEMQSAKQMNFPAPCQYYASLALGRQIKEGQGYQLLKPVIFIGVMDFNLFTSPHHIHRHYIVDSQTGKRALNHLEFHFIELPKFNKSLDELNDIADKWIYMLKNASDMKSISPSFQDPAALNDAFKILEQSTWSDKDLEAYERFWDALRCNEDALATAKHDGQREGLAEGLEKGMAEGEMKAKLEMAKELLKMHDLETVARITKLPLDVVSKGQ